MLPRRFWSKALLVAVLLAAVPAVAANASTAELQAAVDAAAADVTAAQAALTAADSRLANATEAAQDAATGLVEATGADIAAQEALTEADGDVSDATASLQSSQGALADANGDLLAAQAIDCKKQDANSKCNTEKDAAIAAANRDIAAANQAIIAAQAALQTAHNAQTEAASDARAAAGALADADQANTAAAQELADATDARKNAADDLAEAQGVLSAAQAALAAANAAPIIPIVSNPVIVDDGGDDENVPNVPVVDVVDVVVVDGSTPNVPSNETSNVPGDHDPVRGSGNTRPRPHDDRPANGDTPGVNEGPTSGDESNAGNPVTPQPQQPVAPAGEPRDQQVALREADTAADDTTSRDRAADGRTWRDQRAPVDEAPVPDLDDAGDTSAALSAAQLRPAADVSTSGSSTAVVLVVLGGLTIAGAGGAFAVRRRGIA